MTDSKELSVKNTADNFLTFEISPDEDSINVLYENETLWLTQKMMSKLFDVDVRTISEHLQNIYSSGELLKDSTIRKFRIVQLEGKRNVEREIEHYNLDVAISLGYRVNSIRATQFRKWATNVLRKYTIQGYVIDKKRMINGQFLGEDYFERLLEEIREIRISERRFYQKVTDIYATSVDYDKESLISKTFFAKVQNKLHYAITGHTAAEIIRDRANSNMPHMGLTTWESSPDGKILKSDVGIAKNYLLKDEMESLGRMVNAFLDLAEDFAKRQIPMTMENWSERLDKFIEFTGRENLKNSGSISQSEAKKIAEKEYKKYRVIQDKLYKSDFDKLLKDSTTKN